MRRASDRGARRPLNVGGVNWTGLIFGAMAAFWLVYLIPLILNRRENGLLDEVEPGEPFTASVTIVRRGDTLDTAENGTAVVSTPLNRRAALRELADLDRDAARRRRRVLGFLVATSAIVGGLAAFDIVSPWTVALPGALVVLFLVVARFTVRMMRRNLDARAAVIRGGSGVDEETIAIPSIEDELVAHETSVELTAPVEMTGSLWDPIPVTAPTYVSKPLAPRTVRTIDLSAPVTTTPGVPVTADAPPTDLPDADASGERAVG